jgi:hypothetical protein
MKCSRFSDELLNETLFSSLAQARTVLSTWRTDYNGLRPRSKLGRRAPDEFALTFRTRRALTLRNAKSYAPAPAASPAHRGKTNAGKELKLDKSWRQRQGTSAKTTEIRIKQCTPARAEPHRGPTGPQTLVVRGVQLMTLS